MRRREGRGKFLIKFTPMGFKGDWERRILASLLLPEATREKQKAEDPL
jgi:hypothetical protein